MFNNKRTTKTSPSILISKIKLLFFFLPIPHIMFASYSCFVLEIADSYQELLVISNSSIIPQEASLSQDVNCWALILQHTGHTSSNQPHYQIFTLVSLISEQINHIFYLKHNHPIRSITNISWNHYPICSLQKYFFVFPVPFPHFDAIHCNWEEIYFLSPQLNSVLCRTAFGEAAR